jgi:hypothetical protein
MNSIRYYGNLLTRRFLKTPKEEGGTIHSTGHLDVETYDGKVVAVWFRCRTLPFAQTEIGYSRFADLRGHTPNIQLTGVNFVELHDGALDG